MFQDCGHPTEKPGAERIKCAVQMVMQALWRLLRAWVELGKPDEMLVLLGGTLARLRDMAPEVAESIPPQLLCPCASCVGGFARILEAERRVRELPWLVRQGSAEDGEGARRVDPDDSVAMAEFAARVGLPPGKAVMTAEVDLFDVQGAMQALVDSGQPAELAPPLLAVVQVVNSYLGAPEGVHRDRLFVASLMLMQSFVPDEDAVGLVYATLAGNLGAATAKPWVDRFMQECQDAQKQSLGGLLYDMKTGQRIPHIAKAQA